jgi:hypothetical protein
MMKFALCASAVLFALPTAASAALFEYSDRAAFTTATGATSVETFTDGLHFPLPGGVLNSSTVCPACIGGPIPPGQILSGVTYSTEVFSGNGFYFNIDQGARFNGGFLDSIAIGSDPRRTLTVTFDALQSGLGFDTNSAMGNFRVDLFGDGNAALGSFNYSTAFPLTFFGFASSAINIRSARIAGDDQTFNFALDNFTFNTNLSPMGGVPEPASWAMMIAGFGLTGSAMRKRKAFVKPVLA